MKNLTRHLLFVLVLPAIPALARADVAAAPLFRDHAVLRAGTRIPVWGTGEPGRIIEVSIAGQTRRTSVAADGRWRVEFSPIRAGRMLYELTVQGVTRQVFRNVAVGDVWLASGQSNMAMTIRRSQQEDLAAQEPFPADVRFFDGERWQVVTREKLPPLPALPWSFARETALARNRPVGMIVAARGGTRIESWMPRAALVRTESGRRFAELAGRDEVIAAAAGDAAKFKPYPETNLYRWQMGRALPMALYAQLIEPLRDFPLEGVLWYQGENNAATLDDAANYGAQLADLIEAWRGQWRRADLPFYVVGLPEYNPKPTEGTNESWARLRSAQSEVAGRVAGVNWVDARGLGDPADIHPKKKWELGARLARRALESVERREEPGK